MNRAALRDAPGPYMDESLASVPAVTAAPGAQRSVPPSAPIWLHQMRGSGKDRHMKQASIHRASAGDGSRSVTSRNSSSKKVCVPTMSSSSE